MELSDGQRADDHDASQSNKSLTLAYKVDRLSLSMAIVFWSFFGFGQGLATARHKQGTNLAHDRILLNRISVSVVKIRKQTDEFDRMQTEKN